VGRASRPGSQGFQGTQRCPHLAHDDFRGGLAPPCSADPAADGRRGSVDNCRRHCRLRSDGKGRPRRSRRGLAPLAAAASHRPVRTREQWRRRFCRSAGVGRARVVGARGTARLGRGIARRRSRGCRRVARRRCAAGASRTRRRRSGRRRHLRRGADAPGRRGRAGGHRGARRAPAAGCRDRCPERGRRGERRGSRDRTAGSNDRNVFSHEAGPSAAAWTQPMRRNHTRANRHPRDGAGSCRALDCLGPASKATNTCAGMRWSRVAER